MEWQAATAIETKTFFGLLLLLHFSSCKAHLWCSKLKVYLQLGGIPEQELKKLYVHFFSVVYFCIQSSLILLQSFDIY